MRNKQRVLFMLLYCCFVAGIANAQSKKLYTGVTAGWQSSSFHFGRNGAVLPNNGAWRAAMILDYEITSRLSFQSQIGVQKINSLTLFSRIVAGSYRIFTGWRRFFFPERQPAWRVWFCIFAKQWQVCF
jgi:hypothetical protein